MKRLVLLLALAGCGESGQPSLAGTAWWAGFDSLVFATDVRYVRGTGVRQPMGEELAERGAWRDLDEDEIEVTPDETMTPARSRYVIEGERLTLWWGPQLHQQRFEYYRVK